MLSIRTQDRMALVPYNGRIMLTIKDGIKKNSADWEYDTLTIVTPDGGYKELGTYKSKERALEVLDEIEDYIYASMWRDDNVVYHMPKE